MTVFVVSHGSKYEGTSTRAVFDTFEKADIYVRYKVTKCPEFTEIYGAGFILPRNKPARELSFKDYFEPKKQVEKEDLEFRGAEEARQFWYYEGCISCWTVEEYDVQKQVIP